MHTHLIRQTGDVMDSVFSTRTVYRIECIHVHSRSNKKIYDVPNNWREWQSYIDETPQTLVNLVKRRADTRTKKKK